MVCVTILTSIYILMGNNGIVYTAALSALVAGGGYTVGMVKGARLGAAYVQREMEIAEEPPDV